MFQVNDTDEIYLNYEGPFKIRIISTLATFLLENITAPIHERRKLYRVFIELTQNVALYSNDRIQFVDGNFIGTGQVYVLNRPGEFQCVTINKIKNEHYPILRKNCTVINTTPEHDLRSKKNELRKSSYFQDTGAHIGLIMIKIYSGNPIGCEKIESKNDELYVKISASISKR